MRTLTIVAIALIVGVAGLLLLFKWENLGQKEETRAYISPTAASYIPPDPNMKQAHSKIKTVLSYSGRIPSADAVRYYSYRLPFIDLAGSQAVGCNQELEERYGTLIRQSMRAMDRYEQPVLEELDYTSFERDGILTLRVDRRDCNGALSCAYYTVDAETGGPVSVERFFAAAGVAGSPETVLDQAVRALFEAYFGPLDRNDSAYTTALFCTVNALDPKAYNRMHLTEDDTLVVVVELYDPRGGSGYVEMKLP